METRTRQRLLIAGGVAAVAVAVAATEIIVVNTTFDIWGGILVAILLFVVTLPFLAFRRSADACRAILPILVLALAAKLLSAFVYYFVIAEFFGGVADAWGYHVTGGEIARLLRAGDLMGALEEAAGYRGTRTFAGPTSLIGTPFIPLVTGAIYTLTGKTYLGGFVVFSWLAFLGTFFFYRAFTLTFPGADHRKYALLLFFLPSMLFWSSTIGKEAWMMLSSGLAALGAARILESRSMTGTIALGAGTLMMAAVRIHVAGMMGAAVVMAYIFLRQNNQLRELAPVVKGVTLALLLVAGSLLALRGQQYLASHGLDPQAGIATALVELTERTSEAGSDFEPVVVRSPLNFPVAAWTVLFRPHPLEVRDALGALAAAEAAFLLAYVLFRYRNIWRALKSVRDKPYVTLCLTFTLIFIVGFSGYANFGLLVRQRIQVIPFLLLVATFPKLEHAARTRFPSQRDVSLLRWS